jgi:phosphoribosyl 1,2-cyclic phosphodiesterase
LNVTFYGVRGSTPCACATNRRYGGNTACVAIEAPGHDPIVLDLGTGLRFWGETLPQDGSFRGHALVTHLHWDHVQGLPFFVPVNRPGAQFDIYGPTQPDGLSLEAAFGEFMRPPYFPVRVSDLAGEFLQARRATSSSATPRCVRSVPRGRDQRLRIEPTASASCHRVTSSRSTAPHHRRQRA